MYTVTYPGKKHGEDKLFMTLQEALDWMEVNKWYALYSHDDGKLVDYQDVFPVKWQPFMIVNKAIYFWSFFIDFERYSDFEIQKTKDMVYIQTPFITVGWSKW